MNSKKPRNRENRTRSIPAEATVTVHMLLPRSAYEAVSYTHLDVYKRQIHRRRRACPTSWPVSAMSM